MSCDDMYVCENGKWLIEFDCDIHNFIEVLGALFNWDLQSTISDIRKLEAKKK